MKYESRITHHASRITHHASRFLPLTALTGLIGGLSAYGAKALQVPESVPLVGALAELPPKGGEWPFVSVIIPARNEERNLPRLLPSLLGQRYPHYEVIVVDDQSADATPEVLAKWSRRDGRLKVVQGAELPREEGWMGKPFAMSQGAAVARGDWLLFTDADTVHDPLSLSSSVAYAIEHNVDLFTILPCYELVTLAERTIMPSAFVGITALYPAYQVNDPANPTAIANGQYMLIRRDVYDGVGGIERVKDKIVEDLEFAKAVKGDGYRLCLVNGQRLMSVRMYTSFAEIWEGWSKNVVLALQSDARHALLAVLGVLSLTMLPLLMLRWAWSAWRAARRSRSAQDRIAALWVSALAGWGVVVPLVYRRRTDRMLGLSPLWTLTHPLGTAIMGLIMLYSLARLLTGRGVTWKGRTYGAFHASCPIHSLYQRPLSFQARLWVG